ncbi:hypothetical protein ABDX79_08570 [Fulvimarina sp. MAC3]
MVVEVYQCILFAAHFNETEILIRRKAGGADRTCAEAPFLPGKLFGLQEQGEIRKRRRDLHFVDSVMKGDRKGGQTINEVGIEFKAFRCRNGRRIDPGPDFLHSVMCHRVYARHQGRGVLIADLFDCVLGILEILVDFVSDDTRLLHRLTHLCPAAADESCRRPALDLQRVDEVCDNFDLHSRVTKIVHVVITRPRSTQIRLCHEDEECGGY